MKTKFIIPAWLSIAAVWFGMHAGGGFASGQQEVRYFLSSGWTAIFTPFVAMGILGLVNYYMWNFARLTKSYDLRTWVDNFYRPYDLIFANILDILFIVFLCLPTGAAIAGAAELLKHEFNISYFWATLFSCGLLFICTIFGSELVRNVSSLMTVVLLAALAIIVYYGISNNYESSAIIIANKVMTPDTSYFTAFKLAILYAGFQASIGPLVAVAEPLKSRKDVIKTTIAGILINGISLMLICWMLLGAYPLVLDKQISLPVLTIVNSLEMPFLKLCYAVVLFFAFISTGVAFVYASVKRFEKSKFWNFKLFTQKFSFFKNIRMRALIISTITLLYSLAISQFGLVEIVGKGYKYMGWAYLIFIIIPVLIFGHSKCKKAAHQ